MVELVTALEQAHRESPSWRLYGLCHQAATRIAKLEAENARLTKERDAALKLLPEGGQLPDSSENAGRPQLSRTGAVKVKALEWEDSVSPLIGPNVYFSRAATVFGSYRTEQRLPDSWMITAPNGDAIRDENGILAHHETLEAAKAAAQADYEQRILSALEPAAPEGWTHETDEDGLVHAVPPDGWLARELSALEGQQPVDQDLRDAAKAMGAALAREIPLVGSATRPEEQAVTEAMVKAAQAKLRKLGWTYNSDHVRAALKAAMEAGRHE